MGDVIGIVGLILMVLVPLAIHLKKKEKTRTLGNFLYAVLILGVIITTVTFISYRLEQTDDEPTPSQLAKQTPDFDNVNIQKNEEETYSSQPTKEEFDSMEEEIQNPTSLFDMVYLRKSIRVDVEKNKKDNLGNFYSDLINICFRDEDQYIEYYVNKKYKSIEGIIVLSEGDKNTEHEYVVKIYADDNLVYTSPIITSGVLPVEFNVDVSGAEKVKILGEMRDSLAFYEDIYIVECLLRP